MHHRAVRHSPHTQSSHSKNHRQTSCPPPRGVWATHIEGRYRPMSVHQLALYWSCYKAGAITYRQLRVLFAAQEMAERRRYTATPDRPGERPRKPRYTLAELKALVGGRDSKTADAALRGDINRLARAGLLGFSKHELRFAASIEQVAIDDRSAFLNMIGALDHKRRPVPVPRRILRAIAGQFPAGVTAVALATLIRGVFWHKRGSGQQRTMLDEAQASSGGGEGAFRVDHRTKREWIAEVFSISPRTVTAARQTLIDLGWIVPLDTPQWLLNKYGAHDRINPRWGGAGASHEDRGESASPQGDFASESASPCLDQKTSSLRSLNTRRPAPTRAGPAGVSMDPTRKKHKAGRGGHTDELPVKPSIRDIRAADLADTGRLLELHRQAVGLGLSDGSEASKLEFVAMAERARARGERAGALFYWLLRERKTAFITQHCEDRAQRRIKAHSNSIEHDGRGRGGGAGCSLDEEQAPEYTEDERFVLGCIRAASGHRIEEPFRIAQAKGWDRPRWDEARWLCQQKDVGRWRSMDD